MKSLTDILAAIDAPHFYCGISLRNDIVVRAAPIVGYMLKQEWTRAGVRDYCEAKGWKISIVRKQS